MMDSPSVMTAPPTVSDVMAVGNIAAGDSSGGSDAEDDENRKRHNPGVKRACNECRQQKVFLFSSFPQSAVGHACNVTL